MKDKGLENKRVIKRENGRKKKDPERWEKEGSKKNDTG